MLQIAFQEIHLQTWTVANSWSSEITAKSKINVEVAVRVRVNCLVAKQIIICSVASKLSYPPVAWSADIIAHDAIIIFSPLRVCNHRPIYSQANFIPQ